MCAKNTCKPKVRIPIAIPLHLCEEKGLLIKSGIRAISRPMDRFQLLWQHGH